MSIISIIIKVIAFKSLPLFKLARLLRLKPAQLLKAATHTPSRLIKQIERLGAVKTKIFGDVVEKLAKSEPEIFRQAFADEIKQQEKNKKILNQKGSKPFKASTPAQRAKAKVAKAKAKASAKAEAQKTFDELAIAPDLGKLDTKKRKELAKLQNEAALINETQSLSSS